MRWGAATRRTASREEALTRNAGGDGSRGKDEGGGGKRGGGGVMKVTPRLIHTRRQNSLKRHRNANRLAPLDTSHILLSILTPLFSSAPLHLHLPGSYNHPPHPLLSSTMPPVAMSTTPPPPSPRLACIHFDFLPVLVSS